MKEPIKIKLTDAPSAIKVNTLPLISTQHIYDEFGYLFSVEKNNCDHNEDHSQDNS